MNIRRTISADTWERIKTAYASGIGLREIARNMELSENTVLARARREKWTQQVNSAKQIVAPQHSSALTPMHSAAISMHQRAQRHVERMASVSENVIGHVESLEPAEVLEAIHEVEKFDRVARRTFGLSDQSGVGGVLNVSILTNQAAVQVIGQAA